MAYNHGREDRKWRIWKEAEEKLLRECGVDEATIEQIRIADRADFNSNRRFYRWTNDVAEYLEDRILKYFPQTIAEYEQRIVCYEADTALAEQHKPQGEEKFCPMTLRGISYTEKAAAGEMLLAICKEYPLSAPIEIGSYRGFKMEIFYDTVGTHYCLNLCGQAKYKVELGSDPLGNLTRIENELAKLPARLEAAQIKLAETIEQLETAKVEVQKPFTFEEELKEKSEQLNALNIELNLDKKDPAVLDAEPEETEEQPERKCANRER